MATLSWTAVRLKLYCRLGQAAIFNLHINMDVLGLCQDMMVSISGYGRVWRCHSNPAIALSYLVKAKQQFWSTLEDLATNAPSYLRRKLPSTGSHAQ